MLVLKQFVRNRIINPLDLQDWKKVAVSSVFLTQLFLLNCVRPSWKAWSPVMVLIQLPSHRFDTVKIVFAAKPTLKLFTTTRWCCFCLLFFFYWYFNPKLSYFGLMESCWILHIFVYLKPCYWNPVELNVSICGFLFWRKHHRNVKLRFLWFLVVSKFLFLWKEQKSKNKGRGNSPRDATSLFHVPGCAHKYYELLSYIFCITYKLCIGFTYGIGSYS